MFDVKMANSLQSFTHIVFVFVTISCFSSVKAICVDCTHDDVSISIGAFIAILVGGILLLISIPVLICFCCACCCFSGRNKNKTNVYVGGPGQSATNQQINMVQHQQQSHANYPPQSYGNSPSYPSQQQPQYPAYPSARDAGGRGLQNSHQSPSPSYPSSGPGPSSYLQNSPSSASSYPYQSRLPPTPTKLPPYSPMNHSRVATPLVAQLTPYYPPTPSQDYYGSPPNNSSGGLRRAHSSAQSAGYRPQPLHPSNLAPVTPSVLGLQRSTSYLGTGSYPQQQQQQQPFYPQLHQHQLSSGIRRSPSAVNPRSGNIYPQGYDNINAYNPNMNQGYGFQNKY